MLNQKGNKILDGEIIEILPNTMFRIKLFEGGEILGIPSGRMRRGFMRLLPGDHVKVEMTPYDSQRGRITAKI